MNDEEVAQLELISFVRHNRFQRLDQALRAGKNSAGAVAGASKVALRVSISAPASSHTHDHSHSLVETADAHGNTLLIVAAQNNQMHMCRYLVQRAGADVDATNHKGNTALHYAVTYKSARIVKFLLNIVTLPSGSLHSNNAVLGYQELLGS